MRDPQHHPELKGASHVTGTKKGRECEKVTLFFFPFTKRKDGVGGTFLESRTLLDSSLYLKRSLKSVSTSVFDVIRVNCATFLSIAIVIVIKVRQSGILPLHTPIKDLMLRSSREFKIDYCNGKKLRCYVWLYSLL
ncbi:hypothetical protein TNCT_122331 [Trichonephila clavata]|uniref:Uncharacterized protein n=1 Tax=Trichonephila clavata TaxID=2740835 RepID=A0A8X6HCW8_TRICU|nr:hypothetical protein TNCT_122331 [Trichonephila clavata]